METNQYMEMFLDESREHLQSLNDGLLSLENDPEDLSVLNEIFRNAHTLKGMSATMGYTKTAELTHDMENLLDMLRKEQLKVSEEIIDVIFKCVDALQEMVDNIANGDGEDAVDVSELVRMVNAIANGESVEQAEAETGVKLPGTPEAEEGEKSKTAAPAGCELNDTDLLVIKEAKNSGLVPFWVHVEIADTCLLKSARSYMVMNVLDELGDVIKSVPPAQDLEQEKFEHSFEVCIVTAADAKKIEESVAAISEISAVKATEVSLDAPKPAAEEAPKAAAPAAAPKKAAAAKPAASKASDKQPAAKHDKKAHLGGQSVRVDIEKLDSLMNLVGELVTNKVRLEQIGMTHRLTELTETLEQMDRVTTDLQSVVMKVRMVPVSQVFNRFPRMVRDLAKELNKDINLTIEGEDTELDRTVIDEIGDPLMHLLRNSLDHGVEHPDDREAKGKPRTGEVGLIARHEGNNVVIMVTDDGAGINADKIRNKAVEKGMISREEADALPDSDAVRLIFLPGFSTAEVITDVSGRGVGMDVVRSKIESLGGHVDVETQIDKGSVFKIKLPLTLAIIQAMLVKVQDEMYAIPLGSIDSTINITPDDIKTVQNKEVIVLRGQIIPIARLNEVLSVPKGESGNEDDIFVVVVHVGDHKMGIVVDNLIGQQEIVIKTLGKLLSGLKMLAGATVLGDGHVAMILDVSALM